MVLDQTNNFCLISLSILVIKGLMVEIKFLFSEICLSFEMPCDVNGGAEKSPSGFRSTISSPYPLRRARKNMCKSEAFLQKVIAEWWAAANIKFTDVLFLKCLLVQLFSETTVRGKKILITLRQHMLFWWAPMFSEQIRRISFPNRNDISNDYLPNCSQLLTRASHCRSFFGVFCAIKAIT